MELKAMTDCLSDIGDKDYIPFDKLEAFFAEYLK